MRVGAKRSKGQTFLLPSIVSLEPRDTSNGHQVRLGNPTGSPSRLMPQRAPVSLIGGEDVDWIFGEVEGGGQRAEAFHLADVLPVRFEARRAVARLVIESILGAADGVE